MESNTCPQNCEGFPYFPPPWISPNLISSNDNSTPWWATPRWVIIGIVIVAVVAGVYYSFRSYSRHGHQDTTAASPRLEITIVTPDVTIHRWKADSETSEGTTDKPASTASTNPATTTSTNLAPTASTMESSMASTKQSSTTSNQTSSMASTWLPLDPDWGIVS